MSLQTEGAVAALAVSDNGIGTLPETIPSLFDLYVQAESAADNKAGGLGLGLALVKSLVEIHGGTVTATSAGLGCGSTFQVLLPAMSFAASPSPA